jgi:hypothetical protein
VEDEEARGRVSWAEGSRTVVSDIKQLAAEEAAGEGLTSAWLAISPRSEKVLHEEGITVDQIHGLESDEKRWSMVATVSRGDGGNKSESSTKGGRVWS